jgi:TonB family protein
VEDRSAGGKVVVEFVVDKTGRVMLPRIVSASGLGFGYAAVQAIATWRFEPPTSGGNPTMARAQVPFAFKPSAVSEPDDLSIEAN